MTTTATCLAGLEADDVGRNDDRAPLVLLHGLTFDRTMWRPAVDQLQDIDPGRRVLAFDLPGHGGSAGWSSYGVGLLADGVHRAVQEAQLVTPVVVGHSMSAVVATAYAAQHPTRGVVNVDQSLQVAPFAAMVQSLAGQLRGPAFAGIWETFVASMHIERLPDDAQRLLRTSSRPERDLVLAYWSDLLDRPVDEVVAFADATLEAVREARVPYVVVAGEDLDPEDESWLHEVLPDADLTTWAGSGHFPHLAHPRRFAQLLATTGR